MNDIDIYQKLKSFNNYTPTPAINMVFSDLVKYCLDPENKIHLTQTEILDLQKICSLAEEELELDFAKKIINSEKSLEDFVYYINYTQQIKLELDYIFKINKNIKSVLFVGGGPLPMSAILLSKQYNLSCNVIEKNQNYAKISKDLIDKLNIKNINILNTEALDYGGYENYDLVIVSALTKSDTVTKENLINIISSRAQIVLSRYATDNKVLLYPDLNQSIINNIHSVVSPTENIINSSLIIKN